MTEIWKTHPAFPDHEISNLGRVRRYLKPFLMSNGYPHVSLGGKTKRRYLHQLVMEAFVGARPAGQVTRHLDGNPQNNALANLAYGTKLENGADVVAHGRSHQGSLHYKAKFSDETVALIKRRLAEGVLRSALAAEFGVSYETIRGIHSGKTWKHVEAA